MFVQTLLGPLRNGLWVHCRTTFADLVEHGVQVEQALIVEGKLKYGPKNTNPNFPLADKNKFWAKNKYVTNDGLVDAKVVNTMSPIITLKGTQPQNTQPMTQTYAASAIQATQNNDYQNNQGQQQPRKIRQFLRGRTYTPLGEPIEEFLKKCIQTRVITLQAPRSYDPTQFKPAWFDDKVFCDYHQAKGHKTSSCRQLKNLIQDLIEQRVMEVGGPQFPSNADHTIHKNPLQDHGSRNPSMSNANNNNNGANNVCIAYNYSSGPIINNIQMTDEEVCTVTIRKDLECNVTTRGGKVTIASPATPKQPKVRIASPSTSQPPSHPQPKQSQPKAHFNLIDQLGKTLAQILILELLRISPAHKAILDKTLQESSVPQDIDVN